MKKVFTLCLTLLLLCLILPQVPAVSVFADGGYEYTENPTGVTVTSLTEPDNGILIVPEKLDGKPVTDISALALKNRLRITEIRLPDSLTEISAAAFSDCTDLKRVVFGKGLKVIKAYAFSGCSSLESITLPKSVEEVGTGAFKDCTSLESVSFDSLDTIPQSVFNNCTSLKKITFSYLGEVGDAAFANCSSLEAVTFPEGLTRIGGRAFKDCTALKNVKLPEGLSDLDGYAFMGCTALESITLPDSITKISYGLFQDCSSLSEINIGNNVTEVQNSAIDGTAYFDDEKNRTDEVLYLGNYIIHAKHRLPEKVTIRDGVTRIPYGVFNKHYNMLSITLPDSVEVIEGFAFSGCRALKEVNLGSGITEIGHSAFDETNYYNHGDWQDGFLYEGDCLVGVLNDVSGKVTVKEGTRVIANNLFAGNSKISEIELPDSILYIGSGAFARCTGLTEITLPKNLRKVETSLLSGCTYLKTLTVLGKYTEFEEKWCRPDNSYTDDFTPTIETIRGGAGSPSEVAAKELGITFEAIEVPDVPKPEVPKKDQTVEAGGENGANIYLYVGIGLGILVLAAGIIIFLKKKNKKAE